jgi:hypothetical protein
MKKIETIKTDKKFKICGIYMIMFGDYKYIGSSKDIFIRIKSHYKDLISKKHHNRTMQRLFDKYGEVSMFYDVVEVCEQVELLEREKLHISFLKRPYRINHILDPVNIERSNVYKKRLSKGAKLSFAEGREIYNQKETHMYSLDGKFIRSFKNATEAAEYFGSKENFSTICSAARGDNYTAYNYRWSYIKIETLEVLVKEYFVREIVQMNLDYSIIKYWSSITEATNVLDVKNITRAIKKNLTAGGFRWKYK